MATVSEFLRECLREALQTAGIVSEESLQLGPTADSRHGDYQSNAAMVLGKKFGQKPAVLANRIVEALGSSSLYFSAESAGPGFINFRISAGFLTEFLCRLAFDERLGVERSAPKERS